MDDLEAELQKLDREIAQFVLESFQAKAPDALREQLSNALSDGLRPVDRNLSAIVDSIADIRRGISQYGDLNRQKSDEIRAVLESNAQEARQASHGLQQVIAGLRADLSHGEAQRRARLETAGPPMSGNGARRASMPTGNTPILRESQEGFVQDILPATEANPVGRLLRRWGWPAAIIITIAAAISILVVERLIVSRPPTLQPVEQGDGGAPQADKPRADAEQPGELGLDADERGLQRVLTYVATNLKGERQADAYKALCGPGFLVSGGGLGSSAHGPPAPGRDKVLEQCPTLREHWLGQTRSRKEVEAALAVTLAALTQMDNCPSSPPSTLGSREGSPPMARSGKGAGLPDRPATAKDGNDDAKQVTEQWRCLLTEAGRAPQP